MYRVLIAKRFGRSRFHGLYHCDGRYAWDGLHSQRSHVLAKSVAVLLRMLYVARLETSVTLSHRACFFLFSVTLA